jgi:transposase
MVAIKGCSGAHHWTREPRAMGHEGRLIPPTDVKPFVKRHKNDAVDAEPICEAKQKVRTHDCLFACNAMRVTPCRNFLPQGVPGRRNA